MWEKYLQYQHTLLVPCCPNLKGIWLDVLKCTWRTPTNAQSVHLSVWWAPKAMVFNSLASLGKLHGEPQFTCWIFRVPHLVGRGPSCQRQDLISQANAENWCVRSMLHDLRKSRNFFNFFKRSQICPSSVSGSFASNLRIFFQEGTKQTSIPSQKSRS